MMKEDREAIIRRLEAMYGEAEDNETKEALFYAIEALKRPIGECRTCKYYTKGGLDGKTYVCEHPSIDQDDYFNYAFITMDENDFCSCYEARKKEGRDDGKHQS